MAARGIEVRIAGRRDAAEGIICLELTPLDGETLPRFEAGAHVDVYLSFRLVRQYSLCNDPAETNRYRLGILLEKNGKGGSAEIHRDFGAGKVIRIGAPRNQFRLAADARHSVLLAGGIGATPLLAMAYQLSAASRSFEMHYFCRTLSRAAFLDNLLTECFALNVKVHFNDAPADHRFVVPRDIPVPGPGHHFYVCGPKGFMDAMIDAARAKGWPEDSIHLENFAAAAQVDSSRSSFVIEARRSGKSVEVQAGETAAQVLLAAGIDVPLSCESGICGTCLTDVIDGVPDHRDSYLTEEEKAANKQMTVCCSRARTAELVLDI
jgi:vanillate monooxygenase ferredoxin subunit